ncbi:DNA mismatch repair endonuclease MutL [Wenyingzhuangia sp. 2_MG-2023]|uniref:DNA mismatch repair endonuclease MutL n=1 Tax=Wenyingzhuangia sp. 2_MG-2023 TaxID=3062639 RepID=UPI0026E420DD|nr:DNA mismatch repair endonuclease MutL [Wenyingzhuangia sp. 2_MG-2023]MDO6738297.1 DNA mismatch repair endonuclease MutL [Wenyingzhuangia sp. 2_MG-2023]
MPDIIQLLPDHVANQIAAGEVVQRPASVVKELLENAIDAGAKNIHLILKDAGKTIIQVIDDGSGMSETDARLCFERHATSKIREAEDLFNLTTKGFRGEAMASIAAIAQIEMKTKLADKELGTCINIEASKITNQELVTIPAGTNTAVKNLFFNIPARRNFLKSDAVETRHIIDEFQRVALVHFDVAFVLNHNNSEIFNLPSGNLKQRIVNIFGHKTNERLIPIDEETDLISVHGFIMKPEFSKKKRGEQFFFVNDRFIKSPYLHHAINAAFDGLLERGNHPGYFLYLKVPTHTIDINIHPTKTEVKFDNEKVLYEIIRAAVKHSLGQFNMMPSLDFTKDKNLETPYEYKDAPIKAPKIEVDPDFNPFKTENYFNPFEETKNKPLASSNNTKTNFRENHASSKKKEGNWEALYHGIESIANTEIDTQKLAPQLFETKESNLVRDTFQIQNKYILSNLNTGTYLVHQHLAHQRVLYENFLANITVKEASSQQLLFPININYSAQEIHILKNIKEELESTGFLFESITKDAVVVSGIPTTITESQISMVFEQLIEDFQQDIQENSFSQLDMIAKSLSKTLAIRTGTKLSDTEQENLIQDLFACKEANISPFRKKIYTKIDTKKLDAIFNLD